MYRKRGGQDVLCVTCYADRPLAAQATHTVVAQDAQEESVAQTRSFTSMLLLTQYLAAMAGEQTEVVEQLQRLPDAARRIMSDYEETAQQLGERPNVQRFTFLGSGPYYGLACEAMLKMKEMSLAASEAFHFLEFRHGPKSTVGPDMLVVGLVSEAARRQELAVLAEMQQLGAQLLVIAESGDGLPTGDVVELRSGLNDLARAPLYLPLLQLMAYYKALSNGLNPDRPTNLESVVRLDR
jgi:glucosamine--fructose-6-phosphate aminotransferase (isomerizing)